MCLSGVNDGPARPLANDKFRPLFGILAAWIERRYARSAVLPKMYGARET